MGHVMALAENQVEISGDIVWFKGLRAGRLLDVLKALPPAGEIVLETDGVTGRWQRNADLKDGHSVDGIVPVGRMKEIWDGWLVHRAGERVAIDEVAVGGIHAVDPAHPLPGWFSVLDLFDLLDE